MAPIDSLKEKRMSIDYTMKTTKLGFTEASNVKVGDLVVFGGVIHRVARIRDHKVIGWPDDYPDSVRESEHAPYFVLEGVDGWVSWQHCAIYTGRTIKELALEAIQIQDACNPLGLSKGYAQALQELADVLRVEGVYTGSEQIATHAINRLWLDKLCDLARYGRMTHSDSMMEFIAAHDECQRLAGLVTTTHTGGEHEIGGEG